LEEFFERMLCLRFLFFVCVCEERGGSYVYVCLFCLCIVSSLCAFVLSVCVCLVCPLSLSVGSLCVVLSVCRGAFR
jgi:hypothetical protein